MTAQAKKRIAKLTANVLKSFVNEAEPGDRLWDTELKGFHAVKKQSGASYRVFYRNTAGTQKSFTIASYPAQTAEQARKLAKENLGRISAGVDVLENKKLLRQSAKREQQQTLKAYIESVYTLVQRRRKSGKQTIQMLLNHFDMWLELPMNEISQAQASRWQAQKEQEGLKFPTIERIFGALKTCLNHAVTTNTIDSYQLAKFKLERPHLTEDELARAGTERLCLTDAETKALFLGIEAYEETSRRGRRNSRAHGKANLPDLNSCTFVDHVKPWILTMFYSGFRPGDLFGLRWEHVNLAQGTIRKVIEKTAHHQREPRTFPLSDQLIQILSAWHRQNSTPETGYVFPSRKSASGRMAKDAMQKPWRKICQLGGLQEELGLYTLRHNFACQLIFGGADLLTVSKLMAHEDIKTTIKHYGHLKPDVARKYINNFAHANTPTL